MLLIGSGLSANAAIVSTPNVTGFSSEFSAQFAASNLVDGNFSEFASAGDGLDTFVEFTFDAPTTFDRIVVVNRSAPANDRIADYTLTYDGGASGSTSVVRGDVGVSQGGFDALGTQTATTVLLEVDTVADLSGGLNVGALEVYFLDTPAGLSLISGVSVLDSTTPFSGNFAASNAIDGIVGIGGGNGEFATAGTGGFLELDLGSLQTVGGFDFFDRITTGEATSSFSLTFSEDETFDANDVTQTFTGGTQSAEFEGIDARYVRYEQLSGAGNGGVAEIQFYAVPEPSSTALLGLGGLALILRRRK